MRWADVVPAVPPKRTAAPVDERDRDAAIATLTAELMRLLQASPKSPRRKALYELVSRVRAEFTGGAS